MKSLARKKGQKGVALVVALLVLFLLSALAASLIFTTQTEMWKSANYRWLVQSRYAAEAGEQRAANYLTNNLPAPSNPALFDLTKSPVQYNGAPVVLSAVDGVSSNYPDAGALQGFVSALRNQSVSGMGVNASYSAYATLTRLRPITVYGTGVTTYLPTWQITSQATLNTGLHSEKVQLVETIEQNAVPVYQAAALTTAPQCSSVNFEDDKDTDSYDSSQGNYSGSNSDDHGNVVSNGNVNFGGSNNNINGAIITAFPNANGSCSSGSQSAGVSGEEHDSDGEHETDDHEFDDDGSHHDSAPEAEDDIDTDCSTHATCTETGHSEHYDLQPGTYGNLTCSGSCEIHLHAGTYSVNSLYFDNNNIYVDDGPVRINIAGQGTLTNNEACHIGTNAALINSTNLPANLQIVYSGTQKIRDDGDSDEHMTVYAPNSDMERGCTHDLYGAIVAHTLDDKAPTSYHYDKSLANANTTNLVPDRFRVVSFSWSRF